jgi:NMD protein affecting ribosome stability and mRNA decay
MAYCPECGAEFQAGIRRCPECRVDLVEELEDATDQGLVSVKNGVAAEEAKKIKVFLERNGILCVVEKSAAPAPEASSSTMQVLVNQKDEARCQQLLNTQLV